MEDGPTKKVKTDFGDDGRGIPRDPPEEFLGETEDEAPMTVDEGVDTVSSPPASSGAPQSTALILYSPPPTKTPSVGPLDPVTGLPSLPNRVLLTPLPLPIPIKVPKEPEVDWRSGQLVLWKPKEDVVLKALEADGRDTATSDGDAAEMDLD